MGKTRRNIPWSDPLRRYYACGMLEEDFNPIRAGMSWERDRAVAKANPRRKPEWERVQNKKRMAKKWKNLLKVKLSE